MFILTAKVQTLSDEDKYVSRIPDLSVGVWELPIKRNTKFSLNSCSCYEIVTNTTC